MNILITGGAGFIGSHIAEYFHREHHVRILDNFRTGRRANLDGLNVEFIEGSITDREVVKRAMLGIDYVFHLAALVSVPESMRKPLECVEINVNGLLNVLEEASLAKVRKLVFSSSAAVYGNNPVSPKVENMLPEPLSPYAITKLDGEYYCDLYRREGRLQTVSFRYFNVYGPRQDPNSAYAAAVPIFVKKARANEALTIYGDGHQTRDFVNVRDIVAANVLGATTDIQGVFNVGNGNTIDIGTLLRLVMQMTGSKSSVEYLPCREGDIKHSCACIDKVLNRGFKPIIPISMGLLELCENNNYQHA